MFCETVTEDLTNFNPRPREGGDILYTLGSFDDAEFQSTPPRGGRLVAVDGGVQVVLISIHAPARGATDGTSIDFITTEFQSTPPRGGRRGNGGTACGSKNFNPRPREGGDLVASGVNFAMMYFNPRPREGGDVILGVLPLRPDFISIHAPARGATYTLKTTAPSMTFQSTPPRGGRHDLMSKGEGVLTFQSTPPRGGRPAPAWRCSPHSHFNPRPREGGDSGRPPRPSAG